MTRPMSIARGGLAAAAIVGVVVVVAVGTGILPTTAAADGSADPSADGATATGTTAEVTRRTLTIQETLDGTLGYAGDRKVVNQLGGTLTHVPAEGMVLTRGQRLYELDGKRRPVLFYGSRPAWRTMRSGISNGADIQQLEENLQALGYTHKRDKIHVNRHWDADTTRAVKRWQKATGQHVDGIVELGEAIFLPGPIRVTDVPVDVGAGVGPGTTVLTGTTDAKAVTVDLAADRTDLVKVGDTVELGLPDDSTTTGTVETIGTVAEATTDQFGQAGAPTVQMTIALADPGAVEAYTYAPVEVKVVRQSRSDVLAAPVNSLVALLEGGYAVEVVAADGTTHLVGVETGVFQDGWVEVAPTGGGTLTAGDRVTVPS